VRIVKEMARATKGGKVDVVPLKYAGKWIAWSFDHAHIVASGNTTTEARLAAQKAGEARPWLDRAPDADVRFGGPQFRA
jgi:hypothetical protein